MSEVQICFKCYKDKGKCKCDMPYYKDIDNNISDIIRQLNKKGYRTLYSCGGHSNFHYVYIYIKFDSHYTFNVHPAGFVYIQLHNILRFQELKCSSLSIAQRNRLIKSKIETLKCWVRSLPKLKEVS